MPDKKQTNMARIYFRSDDEFETYRTFETILCVEGKDLMAFFNELFANYVSVSKKQILGKRNIVDQTELMAAYEKQFGGTLSRQMIRHHRDTVWEIGKDYFAAPNGEEKTKYRYDLERCLATLEGK